MTITKRALAIIIAIVILAFAGLAATLVLTLGSDASPMSTEQKGTPTTEPPAPVTNTPPPDFDVATPQASLPSPEDFTLEVITLSEHCFGPAGCNVTYRIEPTYHGAGLSSLLRATVIYEVTGGESPVTNSFELLGGSEYRYQPTESASTASASTELTAEVVNVIRN